VLFVGDDWAEAHHDIEIEDEVGRVLARGPWMSTIVNADCGQVLGIVEAATLQLSAAGSLSAARRGGTGSRWWRLIRR
jgi:hypothetical protein